MLTSTQVGAIAENLMVNALLIESKGILSPFRPVADDSGIDILVYPKSGGHTVSLQVKARTVALKKSRGNERGNTVHFEFRRATLAVSERAFCVCLLLSEDGSAITVAWLVPAAELAHHARSTSKKFVVRPSKSLRSRDKYTAFRCSTVPEMVQRILVSAGL